MEEGGTYLEDFLLSLELLPNDMRRDFELVSKILCYRNYSILLYFSILYLICLDERFG